MRFQEKINDPAVRNYFTSIGLMHIEPLGSEGFNLLAIVISIIIRPGCMGCMELFQAP